MSSKHLFKGFLILLEQTSQQAFWHKGAFCLTRLFLFQLQKSDLYQSLQFKPQLNDFRENIYQVTQVERQKVSEREEKARGIAEREAHPR